MTTTHGAGPGARFRSALLAGLIAGFIWMVITVLLDGFSGAAIVGGGFGFLIGAAVVTALVSGVIGGRHSAA